MEVDRENAGERCRNHMTTRVVISAGGTGGHILPALSVTRVLEEMTDTVKTLLVCGARDIELSIYKKEGYDPVVLPIGSRGRRFPEKVRFFARWGSPFFRRSDSCVRSNPTSLSVWEDIARYRW